MEAAPVKVWRAPPAPVPLTLASVVDEAVIPAAIADVVPLANANGADVVFASTAEVWGVVTFCATVT